MQHTKIEWCINPDGTPGYTWNPIMTKPTGQCHFSFDAALNEDMLLEPTKVKKPHTILVCSTIDLFEEYTSSEWIEKIIETVRLCHWHNFIFLTHNSARYKEFNFPSNCWTATYLTGENPAEDEARLTGLLSAVDKRRYIVVEPFRNRISKRVLKKMRRLGKTDGIFIGSGETQVEWLETVESPLFQDFIRQMSNRTT